MKCRILKGGQCEITQGYKAASHRAVDIVGLKGTSHVTDTVLAHTEGTVVWVQTGQKNNPKATGNASSGNCVKIKHPNGYYTLYAHLKSIYVKLNQKVTKGQEIGYMGNTGRSFGAHNHFEVRDTKDNKINPTNYLDADLPATKDMYQTYDNVKNKWLPKVSVGSDDYAGNFGHGVSGLRVSNYTYQAHDKVKNKWLPWVFGDSDYAGNLPNDIDGIRIKNAVYRVHLKGGAWLDWVYKADSTAQGYAGIYGKVIDAVQIK